MGSCLHLGSRVHWRNPWTSWWTKQCCREVAEKLLRFRVFSVAMNYNWLLYLSLLTHIFCKSKQRKTTMLYYQGRTVELQKATFLLLFPLCLFTSSVKVQWSRPKETKYKHTSAAGSSKRIELPVSLPCVGDEKWRHSQTQTSLKDVGSISIFGPQTNRTTLY